VQKCVSCNLQDSISLRQKDIKKQRVHVVSTIDSDSNATRLCDCVIRLPMCGNISLAYYVELFLSRVLWYSTYEKKTMTVLSMGFQGVMKQLIPYDTHYLFP